MSLQDVEERLAALKLSIRRIRAARGEKRPNAPGRRIPVARVADGRSTKAEQHGRVCDECHVRAPLFLFNGSAATCLDCEVELATPRPVRRG